MDEEKFAAAVSFPCPGRHALPTRLPRPRPPTTAAGDVAPPWLCPREREDPEDPGGGQAPDEASAGEWQAAD
eukprot:2788943-Pyramimonas_sp.AAC.1